MTIWKRSDGSVALDWDPPGGPFVVLRWDQWVKLREWFGQLHEGGL